MCGCEIHIVFLNTKIKSTHLVYSTRTVYFMENVPDGESDVSQSYLAMKGPVPVPYRYRERYIWNTIG